MRSPLALLRVRQKGVLRWRVVQTAVTARGLEAFAVVFIRAPSEEERKSLMACLSRTGGDVYYLEEMILA